MSDWTVYRIAGDTLTKLAQPSVSDPSFDSL